MGRNSSSTPNVAAGCSRFGEVAVGMIGVGAARRCPDSDAQIAGAVILETTCCCRCSGFAPSLNVDTNVP